MRSISRREFMAAGAMAAGSAWLAQGCGKQPGTQAVATGPDPASAAMAIARWKGQLEEDPDLMKNVAVKLTTQAIDNIGGIKRFVGNGDRVWIKPNLGFRLGPEFAVNTNPDVVGTLARLCVEAGAKSVKVGDNASYGAEVTYEISGVMKAVRDVGAEMVFLKESHLKEYKLGGERLKVWPLYTDIMESDIVIDVPVVKQHGLCKISVCIKNLMGVAGGPKYQWHTDMPRCLSDLAAFVKPRLSVVDAVRVLTKGGPSGGDLEAVKLTGLVAAGTDMVGLEALGAELLQCDPMQGKTMANAEKLGLGRRDYRSLPLREIEVA